MRRYFTALAIVASLFPSLVHAYEPDNTSWEKIFKGAEVAYKSTQVIPTLLLGVLRIESTYGTGVGKNLATPDEQLKRCKVFKEEEFRGKTYLAKNGTSKEKEEWKNFKDWDESKIKQMAKERCDGYYIQFQKICESDNFNCKETKTSPTFAIGFTQFQPDQWINVQASHPELKNPWGYSDSLTATAFKLKEDGGGVTNTGELLNESKALESYGGDLIYVGLVQAKKADWQEFFNKANKTYCNGNGDLGCTFKKLQTIFSEENNICSVPNFSCLEAKVENDQFASLNKQPTDISTSSTATQSLLVTLKASQTEGPPPVSVTLTAAVSGSAQGTINYTFYCDRADSGTDIKSGNSGKFDGVFDNPKTITCDYPNPGTYTAKVIAERGDAPPAEARVAINVINTASLEITTTALESATEGAPYSATLEAKNGKPQYKWSLYRDSSPLPPGLSIKKKDGVIEGTPTKAGTFNFVVKVEDSSGFLGINDSEDTQALTLTVKEKEREEQTASQTESNPETEPLPPNGQAEDNPSATASPNAPSQLAASAKSSSEIRLAWKNGSSASGVRIERRTGMQTPSQSVQIAEFPSGATSYTDTGLEPDTEYCYRAYAFNSLARSDGFSNDACARTAAKTAVQEQFALSAGSPVCDENDPAGAVVKIHLWWNALSAVTSEAVSFGSASYTVYQDGSRAANVFSGTDLNLTRQAYSVTGKTLSFFVRAVFPGGSRDSNTVSVVIPPDICPGLESYDDEPPEFTVDPPKGRIGPDGGTLTFNVVKVSGGPLRNPKATVTDGWEWVSVVSSQIGENGGTLEIRVEPNTSIFNRNAVIAISADAAVGFNIGLYQEETPPAPILSQNAKWYGVWRDGGNIYHLIADGADIYQSSNIDEVSERGRREAETYVGLADCGAFPDIDSAIQALTEAAQRQGL